MSLNRRKVTAVDPSLPHRVGKILKKPRTTPSPLERKVARAVGAPESGPVLVRSKGTQKVLRIIPVRRDTPDLRKLARIFEVDMRKPAREGIIDRLAERDQGKVA